MWRSWDKTESGMKEEAEEGSPAGSKGDKWTEQRWRMQPGTRDVHGS